MRESHLCLSRTNSFQKSLGCRKAIGFAKLAVPALTCPSLSCSPLSTDKRIYPMPVPASPCSKHRILPEWIALCSQEGPGCTPPMCSQLLPPTGLLVFLLGSDLLSVLTPASPCSIGPCSQTPFLKLFLPVTLQALTKLPHPHLHNASHLHLEPLFHLCTPKCWCYKPPKTVSAYLSGSWACSSCVSKAGELCG